MCLNAPNPISISIFRSHPRTGPPPLGALPPDPRGGEGGVGKGRAGMERAGKGEGRERARRGKEGEGEVCVIAVGGIDPCVCVGLDAYIQGG